MTSVLKKTVFLAPWQNLSQQVKNNKLKGNLRDNMAARTTGSSVKGRMFQNTYSLSQY
jgi:hypothetical protein